MPESDMEVVPAFMRLAVMAPLVLPMLVCGKVSRVGVMVTVPDVVATPVPESAMVCGLLPASSLKFRVAARVPAAIGSK